MAIQSKNTAHSQSAHRHTFINSIELPGKHTL